MVTGVERRAYHQCQEILLIDMSWMVILDIPRHLRDWIYSLHSFSLIYRPSYRQSNHCIGVSGLLRSPDYCGAYLPLKDKSSIENSLRSADGIYYTWALLVTCHKLTVGYVNCSFLNVKMGWHWMEWENRREKSPPLYADPVFTYISSYDPAGCLLLLSNSIIKGSVKHYWRPRQSADAP